MLHYIIAHDSQIYSTYTTQDRCTTLHYTIRICTYAIDYTALPPPVVDDEESYTLSDGRRAVRREVLCESRHVCISLSALDL
jgi:hypothetical protein